MRKMPIWRIALIAVNGACAALFALLLIISLGFLARTTTRVSEEPEDVVAWVIIGLGAAAMTWLTGRATNRLWLNRRDPPSRQSMLWGGIAAIGVSMLLTVGTAFGGGGPVAGFLLSIPLVALALAAGAVGRG